MYDTDATAPDVESDMVALSKRISKGRFLSSDTTWTFVYPGDGRSVVFYVKLLFDMQM
jgi:hypothetical protein